MPDETTLIQFGDSLKSLGNGRVGGYLVRFSDESSPDLAGDFFTAETDFDMEFPGKSSVYYNHGLDETLGKRRLGRAELKVDEVGVWFEAQLQARDRYEEAILRLVDEKKAGLSSGTASHLVTREKAGKAFHVKHWPLGLDASITVTPCEPHNSVMALKAWQDEIKTAGDLLNAPGNESVALGTQGARGTGNYTSFTVDATGQVTAIRTGSGGTPTEVKAELLGESLEEDMTVAALMRLNDALQGKLYSVLYQYAAGDDDAATPEEKIAQLRPAFQEYSDTALRVIAAILSTEPPESDGASSGPVGMFGKSVNAYLDKLPFADYLRVMGTVSAGLGRRVSWAHEQRHIKQGRTFSQANLELLQSVHDGMAGHLGQLRDVLDQHKSAAASLAAPAAPAADPLESLYHDVLRNQARALGLAV